MPKITPKIAFVSLLVCSLLVFGWVLRISTLPHNALNDSLPTLIATSASVVQEVISTTTAVNTPVPTLQAIVNNVTRTPEATITLASPVPSSTPIVPTSLPTTIPPSATATAIATVPKPSGVQVLSVVDIPTQPIVGVTVISVFDSATQAQKQAFMQQVVALGGSVETIDALDSLVVTLPEGVSVPQSAIVQASEPDYYMTLLDTLNDPYAPAQWALNAIAAPQGWADLPANAPQVIVAVIDSGVNSHPDLQGRILAGYDFIQGDSIPQDEEGHGTEVAGVIAANHNTIGIAGVAPNVMIMPLRVFDAQGVGSYSDISNAIVYATDNGADIINLSLGGTTDSAFMQSAIDYAIANNVWVVAAAGNTGNTVLFPARYAPVISVGAISQNMQRSYFSAYGAEVDVYAPGENIISTTNASGYASVSGTSFSSPYVAGALAVNPNIALTGNLTFNNLNIPSLSAPADNATSLTALPVFSWKGGLGATAYELQLDTNSNFANAPTYRTTTSSYTPKNPLAFPTYYWRVRRIDGNAASPWSTVRSLNISVTSMAPIRNVYTTNQPTLSWSRLSWAIGYRVEIYDNASFTGTPVASSGVLDVDTLMWTSPILVDGTYYIRVQGVKSDNSGGYWGQDVWVINSD